MVKHNKREGRGRYTWSDGNYYDGDWHKDLKHGPGIFSWHNGEKYEGEFFEDHRHGVGIRQYANGDMYEVRVEVMVRVSGNSEIRVARVFTLVPMEMCTKDPSRITRRKGSEGKNGPPGLGTKESGCKIRCTALELSTGHREILTRVPTAMG